MTSAQVNSNCFNGQDIRKLAESLYLERTQVQREFNRNYFLLFLARHDDLFDKGKFTSVDEKRRNISLEKVDIYIRDIANALKQVKDLRLIINFDECGFGRRSNYKKRRTCVFSKSCNIQPTCRADIDNNHVSWMCGISAAATHTRHMFITTRKQMDPDFSQTFLHTFGDFVVAP